MFQYLVHFRWKSLKFGQNDIFTSMFVVTTLLVTSKKTP